MRGAPALRAIAPVMSSADLYGAPWYSPGGALSQDAVLTWGTLAALRNLRRDLADGDPADAQAFLAGLSDSRLLHDPFPVADRSALTRYLPWVGEVADGPVDDRAAIVTVWSPSVSEARKRRGIHLLGIDFGTEALTETGTPVPPALGTAVTLGTVAPGRSTPGGTRADSGEPVA